MGPMGDQLVLGIETSCDETAAAVVSGQGRIGSSIVSSQVKWHEAFGGVVPEIASRKHLETINAVIDQSLDGAGISLDDITLIAATTGPGLIGALMVGVATAKSLAYAKNKPLVGVDHLEGHMAAASLEDSRARPPFVALIASGGHTGLYHARAEGDYRLLGETRDDAAGEAFDKIAAHIGLGYPGGPVIDRTARTGDPTAIEFPRAMIHDDSFDFSFSGLKTAAIYYLADLNRRGREAKIDDLAASFQAAVVDVMVAKAVRAVQSVGVEKIVVAGGVAANTWLRARLRAATEQSGIQLFLASPDLSTDNAAMIAWAGYRKYRRGERTELDATPEPRSSLGKTGLS
ncbi:MAG: tRNA (adenosine(37)-N6)-threonylcarbamoyltransferase complex transferase subunit TsaD [Terriglobia bacterium]